MRRVGEVVRTAQRLAVVRTPEDGQHPSMGDRVIDESLDRVGTVVDVFGPVERPYVAVSPDDPDSLPALVGNPLYIR